MVARKLLSSKTESVTEERGGDNAASRLSGLSWNDGLYTTLVVDKADTTLLW
jgi:hypothetical protein